VGEVRVLDVDDVHAWTLDDDELSRTGGKDDRLRGQVPSRYTHLVHDDVLVDTSAAESISYVREIVLGRLKIVSDGFGDLAFFEGNPTGDSGPAGFEVLDPAAAAEVVRRIPPWELHRLHGLLERNGAFGHHGDALEELRTLVGFGRLLVARRDMPLGGGGPPSQPTDLADLASPREEIAQPKKVDTFAAFRLVDDAGNPIADQPYKLELPDGRSVDGKTGPDGHVQVDDVTQRGNCVLRFSKAS
jgi:hypothetical protein